MASKNGLVKYGAYVDVIKYEGTPRECMTCHEIRFMLPIEDEHTDRVFEEAKRVAAQKWKSAYVTETWMYNLR